MGALAYFEVNNFSQFWFLRIILSPLHSKSTADPSKLKSNFQKQKDLQIFGNFAQTGNRIVPVLSKNH